MLFVAGLSPSQFVSNVTLLFVGEWIVGSLLERFGRGPTLALFVRVHQRIVTAWLTFVAVAIHLPTFLLDCGHETRYFVSPYGIDWPCRIAVLFWSFDLVRRWQSFVPMILAYFDLLAVLGCVWVAFVEPVAPLTLLIVWAATGLAASAALEIVRRDARGDIRHRTATALNVALFAAIAFGSLSIFDGPSRVAGMLAFAGLAWTARTERAAWSRLPLAMLLNVQLLALVPTIVCPETAIATLAEHREALALPIALVAALSLVAWRFAPA